MKAPIVALDVETTGTHPERVAYEIGMIRRDDEGERAIQFFVDVDLGKADPFALSIGRYYERHPYGRYLSGRDFTPPKVGEDMQDPLRAAEEVARWTHGAYIIGSNPRFDLETLEALLREWGIVPEWHYHPGDVACMAGGQPPWSASRVAAKLSVPRQSEADAHTALGDARWALDVYDAIVGGQS